MRLPGTVNIPNAKKRKAGRVPVTAEGVVWEPDRVYPIEVFTKAEPEPASRTAGGDAKPAKVQISSNVERLKSVDDLPPNVPDWVKILIVPGLRSGQPQEVSVEERSGLRGVLPATPL